VGRGPLEIEPPRHTASVLAEEHLLRGARARDLVTGEAEVLAYHCLGRKLQVSNRPGDLGAFQHYGDGSQCRLGQAPRDECQVERVHAIAGHGHRRTRGDQPLDVAAVLRDHEDDERYVAFGDLANPVRDASRTPGGHETAHTTTGQRHPVGRGQRRPRVGVPRDRHAAVGDDGLVERVADRFAGERFRLDDSPQSRAGPARTRGPGKPGRFAGFTAEQASNPP
jgi:hypothetical protein